MKLKHLKIVDGMSFLPRGLFTRTFRTYLAGMICKVVFANGFHIAVLVCRLVFAMVANLARDLISDEDRVFFQLFFLSVRAPCGRKLSHHRPILDDIFCIGRTGAPWRVLPDEVGT